jgi:hypothetical protein
MQCRNCGTEIADKAIVCYKCGTATTEARFKPASPAPRRITPLSLITTLLALALIVGYVIYSGSRGPEHAAPQAFTWIAVGVAVIIVVLRAVARRR